MNYRVQIKKKVLKSVKKTPIKVQLKFDALIQDIEETGAYQPKWPHYSKLLKNKYHCHLDKSKKWVACRGKMDDKITIGVYYAGSHENAPY